MYSKRFSALTIPHMFWDRKGSHSILIFTSQSHVLASYTLKNVCLRELLGAFPFIATFSRDSWAAEVTRKRCMVRDFNDEIFGRAVAHSQVHARTSNAFILFPLAARDSFFNIYGQRTRRREKVERGWCDRGCLKKGGEYVTFRTVIFISTWFLFFTHLSNLFFQLPSSLPFLFHHVHIRPLYVALLASK